MQQLYSFEKLTIYKRKKNSREKHFLTCHPYTFYFRLNYGIVKSRILPSHESQNFPLHKTQNITLKINP